MLHPRLIVALLVDADLHLVKTIRFGDRHYLGDPLNAAYVFSDFEVDELLVLDIDASPAGRCIPLPFVSALARFTRVPLTVGGGISSLDQIHDLLACGVEKVNLSAALTHDFELLGRAAARFGSSTISVTLNVHRSSLGEPLASFGRPEGGHSAPLLPVALACEQAGAGELVLNHVDRDGTRQGYDLPLLTTLNDRLSIPLVALGGCGSEADLGALLDTTPFPAAAAGSLFVYAPASRQVLLNYPHCHAWLQQHLSSRGAPAQAEACDQV